MRARFVESVPSSADSVDEIKTEPLQARITEFKQNPKNMMELTDFIDDLLQKAEAEVDQNRKVPKANKSQQVKEKSRQSFSIPDLKTGKVVNRARGFVVRIFDAICNCANNPAAGPTTRFKLRGKRQQSDVNDTAVATEEAFALNKPLESKLKNCREKKDGVKQKAKGVTMAVDPEFVQMLND